ncbi:MAG: Uma2 family endonuclease [Chloroflexota bacterium]|nr:Uma2 family endonuclease [Chloroflexota bacterium]
MAVELKRFRFSRVDYHQLAKVGILKPEARVELIDGEILEMSPIGRRHKISVNRLTDIFAPRLHGAAIVQVQSSIALGEFGEPEPDVVLLRFRADFYAESDETPEDVLLIVEVADSSEAYDRRVKGPLYARFGIPDYWLIDLNRDLVTVYRDPTPDRYATSRVFRRGESVSPLAFPELTVAVDDILG